MLLQITGQPSVLYYAASILEVQLLIILVLSVIWSFVSMLIFYIFIECRIFCSIWRNESLNSSWVTEGAVSSTAVKKCVFHFWPLGNFYLRCFCSTYINNGLPLSPQECSTSLTFDLWLTCPWCELSKSSLGIPSAICKVPACSLFG